MVLLVFGHRNIFADLVLRKWGLAMSSWIDIVVDLAEKQWANHQALLLAQIPHKLQPHGIDLRMLQGGRSLRETIATEASDKLQLVRNPNAELVWGVIPKSASLPNDESSLFQRKSAGATSAPRFKKWFWTAFIKPIPANHKRLILSQSFSDIPESGPSPAGAHQVEANDIVKSEFGTLLDYAAVHAAIAQWASRTNTSLDKFYESLPQTPERPRSALHFPKLSELPEDDLKRIMVPLDIVLKLMR
jgi:hypothetical protein